MIFNSCQMLYVHRENLSYDRSYITHCFVDMCRHCFLSLFVFFLKSRGELQSWYYTMLLWSVVTEHFCDFSLESCFTTASVAPGCLDDPLLSPGRSDNYLCSSGPGSARGLCRRPRCSRHHAVLWSPTTCHVLSRCFLFYLWLEPWETSSVTAL